MIAHHYLSLIYEVYCIWTYP